jgi:hypothetical protein
VHHQKGKLGNLSDAPTHRRGSSVEGEDRGLPESPRPQADATEIVSVRKRESMAKKKKIPEKLQIWIDARKKYRLSHAQVQMARELGLNPKKIRRPCEL